MVAVLISSCGAGDVVTSAGDVASGPFCGNAAGDWTGKTSNGGVILITVRQNNNCKLSGEVAFSPCVPITPITGTVGIFSNFAVETVDGSLYVERTETIDPEGESFVDKSSYRFTNTQNSPGCPPTESGSLRISLRA